MIEQEIRDKYGDVPLVFQNYYKFLFAFLGEAEDGAVIFAMLGGDVESIYKLKVSAIESITIRSHNPEVVKIRMDGCVLFDKHDL